MNRCPLCDGDREEFTICLVCWTVLRGLADIFAVEDTMILVDPSAGLSRGEAKDWRDKMRQAGLKCVAPERTDR